MRISSWGMFAAVILLAGCSKEASGDAAPANAPPAGQTADSSTAQTPPARNDACALLSLAEIRNVLPEATRSERNDNLASHGINACSWYGNGKSPVLDVSIWDADGAEDTPMENARTLGMGIADPLRPAAQQAVRLEKIAGVGEEAVAMAEKSDEARGILSTAALLTFGKDGRIVTVASSDIARRERAAALNDLTVLGKAIAARL